MKLNTVLSRGTGQSHDWPRWPKDGSAGGGIEWHHQPIKSTRSSPVMHQKPWNAYDSPALQGGPGHPRGTTQRVRFKERRFAKGAESLGAMVEAL
ncbi:MAG: hypothetical protein ACKVHP_07530, partial [Verrucomicrobiales bacterium]